MYFILLLLMLVGYAVLQFCNPDGYAIQKSPFSILLLFEVMYCNMLGFSWACIIFLTPYGY